MVLEILEPATLWGLVNLAIALLLSLTLRWHYIRFGSTFSNRAEFSRIFPLIALAVVVVITVVSSGDSPDHGHPRASFLGGVGLAGREDALVFSTEIAATFVDAGDAGAVAAADVAEPTTLGDLDFAKSSANTVARRRFKKVLPGIINIRSDGNHIYAARRVNMGYQWESYGPIEPVD